MKTVLPILIIASCSTSPRALTEPSREIGEAYDTVGVESAILSVDGDREAHGEDNGTGPIQKSLAHDTSKVVANYVSVQRVGDDFIYNDGRRLPGVPVIPDQSTSAKLAIALQKGRDRESMMMRMRVACSGGFEVCLDGTAYLFYEEKDKQGRCSGSWYVTGTLCK